LTRRGKKYRKKESQGDCLWQKKDRKESQGDREKELFTTMLDPRINAHSYFRHVVYIRPAEEKNIQY
jgi:hypothetical protein